MRWLWIGWFGCQGAAHKETEQERAVPAATDEVDETPMDPEGHLSAGHSHSCGIRSDGTLHCWGTDEGDWNYGQVTGTPTGGFRAVSVGGYFSCGVLEEDAGFSCWGENKGPPNPVDTSLAYINAGIDHACGLHLDGAVQCWGDDAYGETSPPDVSFVQVSAGYRHSCGITEDAQALCWGRDAEGQSSVPERDFTAVSAGSYQSCALGLDGAIVCWGEQLSTPPEGAFVQLSVARSGTHACALATDNTIACWGYNEYGQADPPEGTFSHVSAGGTHSCAIDPAGDFHCWGQDNYGEATP